VLIGEIALFLPLLVLVLLLLPKNPFLFLELLLNPLDVFQFEAPKTKFCLFPD